MSDASADRNPAEVALVVLCLVALVLAAGFLPPFDVFGLVDPPDAGSMPGGGPVDLPAGSTTSGTPEASPRRGTPSGDSGNGGGSSGSPLGSTLSVPSSRSRIGDTSRAKVTSVSQVPLFVVESPRDTYWRQAAYTTYTGTAWERSTEWRAIEDGIPGPDRTVGDRELAYRVRLLADSRSLPVAWQPESVRLGDAEARIEASSTGGVRSETALPENATYVARSAAPPRNPDLLRGAGREYPERIRRVYTQLPDGTPERVGEFTARVAAEAETPYGVAVAVRDWLKANKEYSLNVSHDPGEPIADQFLFEMEKGYCQYFATTMVAMLRTQDIPARYVVGFAGGRPVGEGKFLVTSDRGHAWVEVYFPEVGWVRFDPTASGSLPVENLAPPYDLSLNRSAVAGAPVTVAVEKNGSAVVGAPVYVEGERVGWTDSRGEVTTRLPYVANVTIVARRPGSASKYSDDGERSTPRASVAPLSAGANPLPRESSRVYDVAEVPSTLLSQSANGSAKTYRSDTNATVRVGGDLVVGGQALVNATVRGVAIRGGNVTLDGERVGETNASGLAVLSLSGVTPGNHTVGVSRGAVSARTTVTVAKPSTGTPTRTPSPDVSRGPEAIHVSVSAPLGIPLPGGPATVEVRRDGEPVPDAAVRVAGERVGETDSNGTLEVGLPLAGSANVLAAGPSGTRAETTVTGLFRNAAVVLGAFLVVLVGVGALAWRRGLTPRALSRWLAEITSAVARRVVDLLLRFSEAVVRAAGRTRDGLRRLWSWLASLPGEVATRGLAAFRGLDPRRLLRALERWVRGLFRRSEGSNENGSPGQGRRRPTEEEREQSSGAPSTLRDLWREFVAFVAPPRRSTRTPGEIARYAVDRGLPERPVRALTELYRDAEYGGVTPADSRIERAREALASIRASEGDE